MKSIYLLPAIMIAAASPAFAQEDDWTGPYIGVHAGYTGAKSQSDAALSGQWTTETQALRDFVGNNWSSRQSSGDIAAGGQVGYNYQAGGNAVLGLEADISALTGSHGKVRGPAAFSPAVNYTFTDHLDPKHLMSLRARAGFAAGNTLVYATGGWAWARTRLATEAISNGGYSKEGSVTKTLDGYIVGGGVEQKLGNRLSARVEYSYTDQGRANYVTAYRPGSTFVTPPYNESLSQDLRLHLVRVGVNYHF